MTATDPLQTVNGPDVIQTAKSKPNRESLFADRRLAQLPALCLVLSLGLAACQTEESGATTDSQSAQTPGAESSTPRLPPETVTSFPDRGDVTFFLGSHRFHAPRDAVSFHVGSDGDRVSFVTLGVYLPDLLPLSEAVDIRNVNKVLISLEVRDGLEFPNLPRDTAAATAQVDRVLGGEGYIESIDYGLGLRRIVHERRKNYTAYRRLDERQRPVDGRIPIVQCTGSPSSSGWPCTSYGEVPPNIRVIYQFYEANIADWASLDAKVFNLIESYRVEEE